MKGKNDRIKKETEVIKMRKIIMKASAMFLMMIGLISFCTACTAMEDTYYTQIDNNKIEKNNSRGGVVNFNGNMDYLYTLQAYNQKGDKKEVTFGVTRELKEGAFLSLTIEPVRGVTKWSEVQYNELPTKVQSHYKVPKDNE